jgi:putative endopeptidase
MAVRHCGIAGGPGGELAAAMKITRSSRQAAAAGFALALTLGAAESPAAAPLPSGFSTVHMDLTVDPRADFAKFAAGGWYKNFQMPADKSRFGAFDTLEENNWINLKAILEDVSARALPAGSIGQKVGDYFAAAMNTAAIDAAGAQPIAPHLAAIAALRNVDDLSRYLAERRR